MPVEAQIRYFLSVLGRRDSLKKGGDGRRLQTVTGDVAETALNYFDVDEAGVVSLDMTGNGFAPYKFKLPAGARWCSTTEDLIEWDHVPTWTELVKVAKAAVAAADDMYEDYVADEQKVAAIAKEFLADQGARAEQIDRDGVRISGRRFSEGHPVVAEARRRAFDDQEKIKQSNRATLREWIIRYGSDNQRERLAADLLPWSEAHATAETAFYEPLRDFPLYERFEPIQVCECNLEPPYTCNVKFQSVDATELTAEEWEQFARIKAATPSATFQFREHRAQCETALGPTIRRGVIVKFALNQLTFKREFALTGVNQ